LHAGRNAAFRAKQALARLSAVYCPSPTGRASGASSRAIRQRSASAIPPGFDSSRQDCDATDVPWRNTVQSNRFPLLGLILQALLTVLAVIFELIFMLGGKSQASTRAGSNRARNGAPSPRVH
jgi:hypothetical protein